MSSVLEPFDPPALPTPTPATDVNTGAYFSSITPHTEAFEASDGVVHMAVSGANMWIALANGGVEVREVHTGILQHTFSPAPRPSSSTRIWCILPVRRARTASDEEAEEEEPQVWLGLSTGTIEVYHGITYTLLRQLHKHLSGVYCLEGCGSGWKGCDEVVYSGSSDFLIAQWGVEKGQLLRLLKGHANYVRCLYAEGAVLVSGSDDRTVRVWDRESGETLRVGKFHVPTGGVSAICRVGVKMWSGDDSGVLHIWPIRDCAVASTFHPHTGRITTLQKIGSRVYSGSADGTIAVYNAEDGAMLERLSDHAAGGSRVVMVRCAVEVDRHYIWSCGADQTIRCWHHDEPIPMNRFQERLNDMRWYYTTQKPYQEANERLLETHRELSESVLLSQGTEEDIRAYIDSTEPDKRSTAAKCWLLNAKVNEANRRVAGLEKERGELDRQILERKKALELAQSNLKAMTDALTNARANPTAVAPSPPSTSAVGSTPAVVIQPLRPVGVEVPATPPPARVTFSTSYEPVLAGGPPPPPPPTGTAKAPSMKAAFNVLGLQKPSLSREIGDNTPLEKPLKRRDSF
ncbi:unnamed protein product [Phytomonas sp. EM1]|nr:unnamed protein product [Phytomonas sp. EM1]|eukprot:CCW63123.1 unnamed protein product [Phytomonas sp. isolate EM1]